MKVSIITAVYNCVDLIGGVINSVKDQSYPEIEYIVIDGASTDGTVDVIKKNISQIDKYISEPDSGIYEALNKGVKIATGDIVCFLHSDDFFDNTDVIKDIVEIFKKENVDSVYGDLAYVSKNDITKVVRRWKSGIYTEKKLKKGWMPPHPAFFVKKSVYDKYGLYDTSFYISADYDFILRILGKKKISTYYYPKTLYKMRMGGVSNRNLKTIALKSKEDFIALNKNEIGGLGSLIVKNISKIQQFFKKI